MIVSFKIFLYCSVRKNADDLKEALQKVLVPMFCSAMTIASDDQKSKLDKVSRSKPFLCEISKP